MPQPLHPALIIGLGGSGIEIVRRFRRRFHTLYPETPYVRFFGIDTAPQEQDIPDAPKLDDEEFFWASRFDPAEFVGRRTIDGHREIKEWWAGYEGLPLQFVAAGAGQRRPVGRLAFFVHFRDIRESLRTAIQEIYSSETYFKLPDRYQHSLNVYVAASTCGGTGTGMFLDLANVVRQIARDVQPGKDVKVRGLLLLPSAFTGTGQVPSMVGAALRANAFGALTELDYAMSLSIEERTPVRYPGGVVVNRAKAAFDACYLVGNQSSSGAVFTNYDTILERAAIHMMIELASPLREKGESRLDNVQNDIRAAPDYSGRSRLYSSFAADWLELPGARVHVRWAKKYAARIIERLRQPYRGEGESRVKSALGELQRRSAYGHLHAAMDRDGMKAYLPDISDEEEALRDIPAEGRTATDLVQRATALGGAYKRLIGGGASVRGGIEESLRTVTEEVQEVAGGLLGVGSLQDARAFLERVLSEFDRWLTQAADDRRGVDAGAWLSEFTRRANDLAPSVLERFRSARPLFQRAQLDLVEDGIEGARKAAIASLREQVATGILLPEGIREARGHIERLRERVERAYAASEGARAIVDRVLEPAIPAGMGTVLTDDEADAALNDGDRLNVLDEQSKGGLKSLLEGDATAGSQQLAEAVYSRAFPLVSEVVSAFLSSVRISPATIGQRVNELEPFALFTASWAATEGSRRTHRLNLLGLPRHMTAQEPAILQAIEPRRRDNTEVAEHADTDRLMMTGQIHGFPLFALAEVGECQQAYLSTPAAERNLRFTLPEQEARHWDVMPISSDEAMKWFSLALALGRVRREGQRFAYVPNKGASVAFGDSAEDPQVARREAREAFVSSGYAAVVAREVDLKVSKEGNDWIVAKLGDWLKQEKSKAGESDYPPEYRFDFERVDAYYRSIQ